MAYSSCANVGKHAAKPMDTCRQDGCKAELGAGMSPRSSLPPGAASGTDDCADLSSLNKRFRVAAKVAASCQLAEALEHRALEYEAKYGIAGRPLTREWFRMSKEERDHARGIAESAANQVKETKRMEQKRTRQEAIQEVYRSGTAERSVSGALRRGLLYPVKKRLFNTRMKRGISNIRDREKRRSIEDKTDALWFQRVKDMKRVYADMSSSGSDSEDSDDSGAGRNKTHTQTGQLDEEIEEMYLARNMPDPIGRRIGMPTAACDRTTPS